jgi:DHA2 family multidrug resistance protein
MALQVTPDRNVVESGGSLVLITVGVMLATLMQTLDTTIVNVALPTIQGNLGATQDEGAWVVTGYIISAVIVIPLTPWLQRRFGRRAYYGTAIVGFTVASVFCGTATSIQQLVIWRVIQGLFGGGLVATAQATLRDTFPRERLGASQALFALGAIVGPSVGPTLGGWLTDNVSWNYVFFINVVPGAVAAIIIFLRLKNPNDAAPLPVDAVGLGFLAVGLGSLQYVLDEGQRNDWFSDPLVTSLTLLSAFGLVAFVLWELYGTARPIVDLRVFHYRAVASGSLLSFAIGAVLFGAIVILPQYLQGVLGFTATLSGEIIFVRAIFIALFTPFVVRIAGSGKIDVRLFLTVGFALIGSGQIWLGYVTTPGSDFASLLGPTILGGIGLALLFTPISIAVLSAVPAEVAPKATAFQSLSLQLGGSFSTASLITLLARRTAFHQETLAQNATLARVAVQQVLHQPNALARLASQISIQATTLSYADCQFALGALTFALMPLILLMPRRRLGATRPVSIPAE